ncbi:MAG: hypothetical protein R6V07_10820 [Armatimonadota bacterium]
MPKHRLSLPPQAWPPALHERFEASFQNATPNQRPRLEQGLGRWLLAAQVESVAPETITPELISTRAATMRPELAGAMKQALQAVYPEAHVFAPTAPVAREPGRASLKREIARNWHRLPVPWQDAAQPLLRIDPEGLEDGALVQAWAVEGLRSRLQAAWAFHDFCSANGLPQDVTPQTVAARLEERHAAFKLGDFSIATAVGEIQRLKALGQALFPDRNWVWMDPVIAFLKKKAKSQPTRNNGRLVSLVELKEAATQAGEVAFKGHRKARGHKSRDSAHKLARSGLAISMLVNSPIRLDCLAHLDLERHFNGDLTILYLSAQETKDGKQDVRAISPELRVQILAYIGNHRRVVAAPAETALFLGSRGKPVGAGYLSQSIGDLTEKLFGRRVTAHVVRNVVAGFIVSEAPEEAELAGEVLNHSDPRSTETYREAAPQIQASVRLAEATDATRSQIAPADVVQKQSAGHARRPPRVPRARVTRQR